MFAVKQNLQDEETFQLTVATTSLFEYSIPSVWLGVSDKLFVAAEEETMGAGACVQATGGQRGGGHTGWRW